MGDLDRGGASQRLPVEGEEATFAVAVKDFVERVCVKVELAQFAPADAASRVLRGGIDAHEAEEHLAAGSLRARVEAPVELLRAAAQRADDPAGRHVTLEREHVARTCGEEFGERVLQQRQCAGLLVDVGDDLRDEAWLETYADALRGSLDRVREFVLRRGGDCHHARAQQLSELRVTERMVEEVRSQSEHDAHPRAWVAGERGEAVEERAPSLLVGRQRKELLELVDGEQQVGSLREDPLRDPAHAQLVAREVLDEIVRPLHRDTQDRRGQLLERIPAREHVADDPPVRAGQRAVAQRRHQSRLHDGRFPDPRRAHDGDQAVVADRGGELADERLASVEVVGVGLAERLKALVRILRGRIRLVERDRVGTDRGRQVGQERLHRLVALAGIRRGRANDDVTKRGR